MTTAMNAPRVQRDPRPEGIVAHHPTLDDGQQESQSRARAHDGQDRSAESQLIVEMIPSLRGFAKSLCRNQSEADDIVQETLVRALGSIHQFKPGTNMKAWLFRIERNVFYTRYRKKAREAELPVKETDFGVSMDAPQEWSVKMQSMHLALQRLRGEQKQALLLVSGSGLSYEEAADVCGCALGTIKSRVSRARTRLLELLEAEDHEDFLEVDRHLL